MLGNIIYFKNLDISDYKLNQKKTESILCPDLDNKEHTLSFFRKVKHDT